MAKIAFLGTGLMGAGMAGRLLNAGHEVHIYNRTRNKASKLEKLGAFLCDSPAMAAQEADVIFSMLSDDEASRSVWCGEDGILSSDLKTGALAIECSTLSHDWVMMLAKDCQKAELKYLDCPVTGLPEASAAGELVLFLGGSEQTINEAQPYLDAISTSQVHFGDIGAGTAYKLIVNLMGSIQIAAAAEGMIVAERCGLDIKKVAHALGTGGAGSPQVARNSGLMATGAHDTDILFNGRLRLKDTDYGVKLAEKFGAAGQLGQVTRDVFKQSIEDGFGELAESKIIDSLRERLK